MAAELRAEACWKAEGQVPWFPPELPGPGRTSPSILCQKLTKSAADASMGFHGSSNTSSSLFSVRTGPGTSIVNHLKKRILVQDQGGFGFQIAGIRRYSEDLQPESNTEIGPKDYFEMACK